MTRETFTERTERLGADSERLRELERLLAGLEPELKDQSVAERRFAALAMLIADSVVDGDEFALDLVLPRLQWLYARHRSYAKDSAGWEVAGRFLGLVDLCRPALERVQPLQLLSEIEQGSHAQQFLATLRDADIVSNGELVEALETDETEISRVGRRLVQGGLARKRRIGRRNRWELTPRGVQVLELLGSEGSSRHQRPQPLRR